jgi:hypothetical protein
VSDESAGGLRRRPEVGFPRWWLWFFTAEVLSLCEEGAWERALGVGRSLSQPGGLRTRSEVTVRASGNWDTDIVGSNPARRARNWISVMAPCQGLGVAKIQPDWSRR